eukprot:326150-Chlamydomonas_euryale.AAC.2
MSTRKLSQAGSIQGLSSGSMCWSITALCAWDGLTSGGCLAWPRSSAPPAEWSITRRIRICVDGTPSTPLTLAAAATAACTCRPPPAVRRWRV